MKLTPVELPAATAPTLVRPLGSFEQFFWLFDQHRPIHFALAAQIEGATTLGRWRVALDLLQRRHPFFSVSIKKNGNSAPYFCRETATIPLRVVQGKDVVRRWESEIERELSTPFSAEQAPLVRVTLLHEANRAVCILVAHHAIADGLSIAYAIRDLLQVLSGNPIDLLPVIPPHEEILGLTRDQENQAEANQESNTASGRPKSYLGRELRPRIKGLQLSPELTRKLRERARTERTTVHGALCAAFALGYREIFVELKEEPICVLSPIDTRKLLNLGEDCAVLVASGLVVFEPRPATFWDIARYARTGLAPAQTLEGIAASRSRVHQMVSNGIDVPTVAAVTAEGFAHDICVTNLGNLPYETEFGELKLEAVWGPAASMRMEGAQAIGVATTNGALCLIQTSFGSDSLLEVTERILISACAN